MSREILKVSDFNKGSMLKQGDTTVLKYRLYDADEENISDNIIGEEAEVVFLNSGEVYYRTTGRVNDLFLCEFSIDEVLPTGMYHIEFIVDGSIYPSGDKPYFTITKSSKGNDINLIKTYGFEDLVVRTVEEVEKNLEDTVALIESEEAARQATFEENEAERQETFETAEVERESGEQTRNSNENERETAENIRQQQEREREANELIRTDGMVKLKNLIVNGDFSKGLEGWSFGTFDAKMKIENEIAKLESMYAAYAPYYKINIKQNHHYYISGLIQNRNFDASSQLTFAFTNGEIADTANSQTSSDYSLEINKTSFSFVTKKMIADKDYTAFVPMRLTSSFDSPKSINMDNLILIDLTATFGVGNEPNKIEMDELIKLTGYIHGEITLSQKYLLIWQLKLIRQNRNAIIALGGTL